MKTYILFKALANYRLLLVGSATDTVVNVFGDGGGNGTYCSGSSIDQLKNVAFPPGKMHVSVKGLYTLDIFAHNIQIKR